MRWLSRLLRRNTLVARRPHPPPLPDRRGRAQKIAQLVTTLSFYADANNYASREPCPILRDGGGRARHVLALLNGDQQ